MNNAPCTAKIRPFSDDKELICHLDEHGVETQHVATVKDLAYVGSSTELFWFENDRRNFRGPWVPCALGTCIFPNGHAGNCA